MRSRLAVDDAKVRASSASRSSLAVERRTRPLDGLERELPRPVECATSGRHARGHVDVLAGECAPGGRSSRAARMQGQRRRPVAKMIPAPCRASKSPAQSRMSSAIWKRCRARARSRRARPPPPRRRPPRKACRSSASSVPGSPRRSYRAGTPGASDASPRASARARVGEDTDGGCVARSRQLGKARANR